MNPPESILEKIRALLRLAKSDNVHEAALAMQKAVELATKHALDLSDISPDDDLNKIIGERLPCPARLAREYVEAFNIVHGFFNVNLTVIKGSGRVLFVGTQMDIEIADYVCTFLVRSCRECLAKYKAQEKQARRKTTGAKIVNYIEGFFFAIRLNLRKQREAQKAENAGLAIVLSNGHAAREAAASELLKGGGKVTTLATAPVRKDRRAMFSGYLAGDKTQINPGLRGDSSMLTLN